MKKTRTMKETALIILIALATLGVWAFSPQAQASGVSGAAGMGACAAGYTRTIPHYCRSDTQNSTVLVVDTCTTFAPVSQKQKGFLIGVDLRARAANAILARQTTLSFYDSALCNILQPATFAGMLIAAAKEISAQTALTELSRNQIVLPVMPNNVGASIWAKYTDDVGNNGVAVIYILGYYD